MGRTVQLVAAQVGEGGGALGRPVAGAVARWAERRGLSLRVRDDAGEIGEGEASPLPGYSVDSLDCARSVLKAVPWHRLPPFDLERPIATQVRAALDRVGPESPSARFAVETALLDLLGKRLGLPAHRLLAPEGGADAVPLCALLRERSAAAAAAEARHAVELGFGALKLKVGADLESDLACVRSVRRAVGPAVALRLDANRSLPPDRAQELLSAFGEVQPELFEEPVPAEVVASSLRDAGVALAADESLHDPAAREQVRALTRSRRYRTWVLKPAALGGAFACLDLAAEARALGADAIASHLFDGPVAWAATAALALALGDTRPMGVALHAGLDAWPDRGLASRVANGVLRPPDASGLGLWPDEEEGRSR